MKKSRWYVITCQVKRDGSDEMVVGFIQAYAFNFRSDAEEVVRKNKYSLKWKRYNKDDAPRKYRIRRIYF